MEGASGCRGCLEDLEIVEVLLLCCNQYVWRSVCCVLELGLWWFRTCELKLLGSFVRDTALPRYCVAKAVKRGTACACLIQFQARCLGFDAALLLSERRSMDCEPRRLEQEGSRMKRNAVHYCSSGECLVNALLYQKIEKTEYRPQLVFTVAS